MCMYIVSAPVGLDMKETGLPKELPVVLEISKETQVKIQKQSVSIVYPKGTLKTI